MQINKQDKHKDGKKKHNKANALARDVAKHT